MVTEVQSCGDATTAEREITGNSWSDVLGAVSVLLLVVFASVLAITILLSVLGTWQIAPVCVLSIGGILLSCFVFLGAAAKRKNCLPRKTGLGLIACLHIVLAISLSLLLAKVHFLRYWGSMQLTPLLLQGIFWLIPIILLMVIGLGLFRRRRWARLLAIAFHWPLCLGSIGACMYLVLSELVVRVGMYWPIAIVAAVVLLSIASVSALVLWYMHRHIGRCES